MVTISTMAPPRPPRGDAIGYGNLFHYAVGLTVALTRHYPSLDVARAALSYAVDTLVAQLGLYEEALGEILRGHAPLPQVEEIYKWADARPRFATIRSRLIWRPEPKAEGIVASLFTGAYGLDLGFELAGFTVAVALDLSESSMRFVKANRPKLPFLLGDVVHIRPEDYLKEGGLKPGEVDVLTAGPPCQPFSSFGKRLEWLDPRAAAIKALEKYIAYIKPRAVVVEEVPTAKRALLPYLRYVASRLGYKLSHAVLNAWDYDTAQDRKRLIIVLTKKRAWKSPLPSPRRPVFAEVAPPGSEDIGYIKLPESIAEYIRYVPGGGSWRVLPPRLAAKAMGRATLKPGGKTGFLRRVAWFWPAPTLVANPARKGTTIAHPWEDRPLGVREYALVQGFPRDWVIPLPVRRAYELIGQAVPVGLAYHVARSVAVLLDGR